MSGRDNPGAPSGGPEPAAYEDAIADLLAGDRDVATVGAPPFATAPASAERLWAVIAAASDHVVAPALLQPAELFVELAGEEFRKRLFLTEDVGGRELCLRPDFTIPVCQEHLATRHGTPATYAYRGKVFRKRRAVGAPEFEQVGTEWIGHGDALVTDAQVFALALDCARVVELAPDIKVGDANVFLALAEALGLSPSWRERLGAAFGDDVRLSGALDRLARRTDADGLAARLAPALALVGPEAARKIVDAVIGLPGPIPAGGRTADDIAERILERAAANGEAVAAADVAARYLTLSAPLDRAPDAIAAFARSEGLALDAAIEAFAARTDAMRAEGIAVSAPTFDASFGRRIGYYTGFVFEMTDPAEPAAEVIAGGRYDRLIALLDPAAPLPGIGFSVWLDRLPAART